MSTSKLQQYVNKKLSTSYGQLTIRENYRPEWLSTGDGGSLELDFFIEEISVAIEVQGIQHYTYVPFFHGDYDGFLNRLEADRRKKTICTHQNITVFEVACRSDFRKCLETINTLLGKEKKDKRLTVSERTRKEKAAERHSRLLIRRLIRRAERQLAEMEAQPNNKTIEPGYIKTIERITYHLENGSFTREQVEQHLERARAQCFAN